MIKENWRDIEGYEGLYMVSDRGRVKSLNYRNTGKEKILKRIKNKWGYLTIRLHKDGKQKDYRVNRLVAKTFIPNPENYPDVNHRDEDKTNNAVDNLEWCTRKHNCNYGSRNEKISKSKNIPVMCIETGEVFSSYKEAQEKTGIFANSIGACAKHKKRHYTAGRFHWKLV